MDSINHGLIFSHNSPTVVSESLQVRPRITKRARWMIQQNGTSNSKTPSGGDGRHNGWYMAAQPDKHKVCQLPFFLCSVQFLSLSSNHKNFVLHHIQTEAQCKTRESEKFVQGPQRDAGIHFSKISMTFSGLFYFCGLALIANMPCPILLTGYVGGRKI